jgi:parvulin-like peptidyl-prolyl isomerase
MAFTAACGVQGASKPPADAVAVVNGQVLTVKDWKLATNATDLLQQVTLPTTKSAEKKQVKELADQLAVQQYALKHHWITRAKAASEANAFVTQNVLTALGGAAKADAALKQQHLTQKSFTSYMTGQMLMEAAFAHVVKSVKTPTTAQLQAYYNTHQSSFSQDKMRMILVSKLSLAQSIMKQLQNGGSWATLAKKYSLDTYSKNKGGEYGWVSTGPASNFVTPFYVEMDKLKPGQYGIAHTQYGYHVIQVQATRYEPFATVQAQLSSTLLQTHQDAAFQKFMNTVSKAAHIQLPV